MTTLNWLSFPTKQQILFPMKLVSMVLLVGLALLLFFFGSGEISPVATWVTTKSNAQISLPSFVVPDNEDVIPQDIVIEKCDLFTGTWIPNPSGPIYTNNTCHFISGHQNCITNGRPDSGFLYWKWKPRDCSLPVFDARKFLQLMRNKSWALIGDSISRNHVESLLCMLSTVEEPIEVYHDKDYRSKRWQFPSHNFTISNIWSPFLVEAAIFEDFNGVSKAIIQLQLDRLDKTWTDLYPSLDYAIISTGKWFLKGAVYHENGKPVGCHFCPENSNLKDLGFVYAYNTSLRHVMEFLVQSNHKGKIFFRTSTPDHFELAEWNNGGTCPKTEPVGEEYIEIKELNKILRDVELNEFERAVQEASENRAGMRLLDFTGMLLTRPDGHPGPYRQYRPYEKDKKAQIQNDCLHWCLPGPIDYLNDVIMELILNG